MSTSKTVLITGATAGIGRMTALHLAKLGHHVIASGRKPAELTKLVREAGNLPGKLDAIQLDVTDAASIAAAVDAVDKLTSGRGLDVLVNNAGFGVLGPAAEITDGELRRQFETNLFGLMSVTRAFLPRMRERRAGRIINVSSVGGRLTLPYFGAYNATKYAVEALSDALRYELQPFGIDISLIEPGLIRTNFEATAMTSLDAHTASPYAGAIAKTEALHRKVAKNAAEPIVIAKAIARAVAARRPAARYLAPANTYAMLAMKTLLPTRVWDWAMRQLGSLTVRGMAMPASAPAAAKHELRAS